MAINVVLRVVPSYKVGEIHTLVLNRVILLLPILQRHTIDI